MARVRSAGRWAMPPLAAVLAFASGCRWLPSRPPERAPTPLGRAIAPPGDAPLPALPPMRSIDDEEAFRPGVPTPLLDAASHRDAELKRVIAVDSPQVVQPVIVVEESNFGPDAPPKSDEVVPDFGPEAIPEPAPQPSINGPGPGPKSVASVGHFGPGPAPESAPDDAPAEPAAFQPPSEVAPPPAESPPDAGSPLWDYVLEALATAPEEGSTPGDPPPPAPEAPAEFVVSDLRLCRRVFGFGRIEPLPIEAVRPGGALLLYCELEGVRDEQVPEGFRSRLASSVEIIPAAGGVAVHREDFPPVEDLCDRRRRDFYLSQRLTIPASLPPGDYLIRLTQRDLQSGSEASRSLAATIRPK